MPVYFDTIDAQETLTRMQIQIRDVGHEIIPEQLMTWQREDMHRQYPFVTAPNYVSAETSVWPRSRTYEQMHKSKARQTKRLSALPRAVGTLGKPIPRKGTGTSTARPILRPELFDKLVERMGAMLSANLKWVTSHSEGAQPPTSGPDLNAQRRLAMLKPSGS